MPFIWLLSVQNAAIAEINREYVLYFLETPATRVPFLVTKRAQTNAHYECKSSVNITAEARAAASAKHLRAQPALLIYGERMLLFADKQMSCQWNTASHLTGGLYTWHTYGNWFIMQLTLGAIVKWVEWFNIYMTNDATDNYLNDNFIICGGMEEDTRHIHFVWFFWTNQWILCFRELVKKNGM